MAMHKAEIIEWLNTLDDEALVGIDDGGLSLVVVGDPVPYCEIGGIPEDEEEDA